MRSTNRERWLKMRNVSGGKASKARGKKRSTQGHRLKKAKGWRCFP